jgi:hypothetical protein
MANVKISGLPKETIISNTDEFPFNKGTTTSSVTFNAFKSNLSGSYIPKPSSPANGSVLTFNNNVWEGQDIVTSILNSMLKIRAKVNFKTVNSSNNFDESKFLTVKANRTSNTKVVTINYSGLQPKYKDPNKPFFIKGQCIGIKADSGIADRLYKITDINYTANTFTINTFGGDDTDAGMVNKDVSLTLVYDNVDETDSSGYNVKCIYQDNTVKGKYYVCFLEDIFTKSRKGDNLVDIPNSNLLLQGFAIVKSTLNIPDFRLTFDAVKTTNDIENAKRGDNGIGYGANSMGMSIGLYYTGENTVGSGDLLSAYITVIS